MMNRPAQSGKYTFELRGDAEGLVKNPPAGHALCGGRFGAVTAGSLLGNADRIDLSTAGHV
jgi:hypothetical protein